MGLSHILFLPEGLLNLNLSPECALMHRNDIQNTYQPTNQPDSTQQRTGLGPGDPYCVQTEVSPHLATSTAARLCTETLPCWCTILPLKSSSPGFVLGFRGSHSVLSPLISSPPYFSLVFSICYLLIILHSKPL